MAEWKLVPVEPTPEMIAAGGEVTGLPRMIYRRMLAASPAAGQQAEPTDLMRNAQAFVDLAASNALTPRVPSMAVSFIVQLIAALARNPSERTE